MTSLRGDGPANRSQPAPKGLSDMGDSIRSFLQQWAAAECAGDAVALRELLADDFVGIGPVGFVLPKAGWIGRHGQGLRYDAFDVDDVQIRSYGDVAVAVGTAVTRPLPNSER